MSRSIKHGDDITDAEVITEAKSRRQRRYNAVKSTPSVDDIAVDRKKSDIRHLDESQRDSVVGLSVDKTIVRSMAFGKTSVQIASDGTISWCTGMIYDDVPAESIVVGVLEDSAVVDGMPFPKGVCTIFGGADTAKTPLLHYLMRRTGGTHVRYGEPLPGYYRSEQLAAAAIMNAPGTIIGLDSLKNLVGRLSGGLMEAGVSRELFPMLSDWSSYFAERGQTLITIINASSSSDRVESMMVEALKSNVTMLIHAKPDGRLEWLARRGSGMKRRTGVHRIEWEGDGKIRALINNSESSREPASSLRNVPPSVDVGVTSFQTAMSHIVARSLANSRK